MTMTDDDEGEEEEEEDEHERRGSVFSRDLHVSYLLGVLRGLPKAYASQESNRLTLAYFAVSGLDLLDALDQIQSREQIIEWVYSLQVVPSSAPGESLAEAAAGFGFRGSPSAGIPYTPGGAAPVSHDGANIAMAYSGLCILKILGDDLARVRRQPLLDTLRRLQLPDGSFMPVVTGAEADMRFVFCAAAVSHMLGDFSGIDAGAARSFVSSSQSFEEGFGLAPGLEAHGGATYCAVATLELLGQLDLAEEAATPSDSRSQAAGHQQLDRSGVIGWCLQRQLADDGGLQGRCNKPSDSCYSFWLGATLSMLGAYQLLPTQPLREFVLSCQNEASGGFSKWPDSWPDLLHTYYSICGLSLLGERSLKPLFCPLGISLAAAGELATRNRSRVASVNS